MKRSTEVMEKVLGCTACDPRMVEARSNIVLARPGKTYWEGGLAFLADSPSEADDASGRPLTPTNNRGHKNGGAVFDDLLKLAGIEREAVLLMTRIRCHPPRNRIDDYPEALTNCDPWNVLEFETYKPGVVVLLGAKVLAPVFGANPKVGELRGVHRQTGEKFGWGARLWVGTYNPAAVGRNPDLTAEVVDDFKAAWDAALPF